MFEKFADYFVYNILSFSPDTNFGAASHFFVYDSLKILFLLFMIMVVISFLRSFFDGNKIKKSVEKQPKFIAYLTAGILGAVTPFCSCSSIPLFIGLMEAGVPFGVAMTFLITSPLINEVMIFILAGVIGAKVTGLYILTGLLLGITGGCLMEKMNFQKYLQDYILNSANRNSPTSCSCLDNTIIKNTIIDRIKNSVNYAKDLFSKIWFFVLIGIAFGAGLHGYVPTEFITKYLGAHNALAVPFAVLFGIPLYSDAATIIPTAQVLIEKGAGIGTVLVFMMSTVAISLPELIILLKVMKKELIIRFVIFMFVIFVITGYFYNLIL